MQNACACVNSRGCIRRRPFKSQINSMREENTMTKRQLISIVTLFAVILAGLVGSASASSHREAPLISQDPTADNTDLYAFVSPDNPNTVTIVANYIPLEEPAGGP